MTTVCRSACIAFILLMCSSAVVADSAVPIQLDLSSVSQMAIQRNLNIKAAEQDLNTARHQVLEAKGYKRGKVEAGAEYLHLNNDILIYSPSITLPSELPVIGGLSMTPPPTKVAPQDLVHLTLGAGYPLYTGGKIQYAINQAEYGVAAREALVGDAESSAILDAVGYYLGALLAKQVVDVNQQALDTYKEHLAHAQIAYSKGIVAKYDVIRAETAVKEQEKGLTEVRNRYNLALAALKTSLDLDKNTPIEIKGSMFEPSETLSIDQAFDLAADNNQILKALDAKLRAQEMTGKVEKAGEKPQVTAVAKQELLTNNIAQTDPHWLVGVQANFELFNGGVRKARAEQRKTERDRTAVDRQSAANQIKLAIQKCYLDLDSARSALDLARKSEQLAQESLRLATKRFEVGTGTSLEVLDANVSLSAARVSEYQSLYQLDIAYLTLHRYLNDISTVVQEVQK